jgi:hypothetical protein
MDSIGCSDRRIWSRSLPRNPGGAPFLVAEAGAKERRLEELRFPKVDYHLDESDPDIMILRRQAGTFVAAFSAQGATKEGIVETAKEDYGRLVEAYAAQQGQSTEGQRSRHESA